MVGLLFSLFFKPIARYGAGVDAVFPHAQRQSYFLLYEYDKLRLFLLNTPTLKNV